MEENNTLKERGQKVAELKGEIDLMKAQLGLRQSEYETLCFDVVKLLEAAEIDSVKMFGFTFYVEERESVTTPKTLEDKKELFEYLKEQGLFEELVGVNSQTLNSFYKTQAKAALEEGILDFKLPGVPPPTVSKNLRLRKI